MDDYHNFRDNLLFPTKGQAVWSPWTSARDDLEMETPESKISRVLDFFFVSILRAY